MADGQMGRWLIAEDRWQMAEARQSNRSAESLDQVQEEIGRGLEQGRPPDPGHCPSWSSAICPYHLPSAIPHRNFSIAQGSDSTGGGVRRGRASAWAP